MPITQKDTTFVTAPNAWRCTERKVAEGTSCDKRKGTVCHGEAQCYTVNDAEGHLSSGTRRSSVSAHVTDDTREGSADAIL